MNARLETATAHEAWNARWTTEIGRADWTVPEPDVVAWADRLAARGVPLKALDLGCGVGRHALALAERGFEAFAMDAAPNGIATLKQEAARRSLAIDTRIGHMTELPYADATFDYVLSFNVIYHGDETVVRRAISEIRRVLKPGAIYQGTMLSKRDHYFGQGVEVAPDTFVLEGEDDKAHPHFYCDAAGLVALFDGFELWELFDKEHTRPGSWHWHMVAERAG